MANKTDKANQILERSCFIGKPLLELPYKEFESTSSRVSDRSDGSSARSCRPTLMISKRLFLSFVSGDMVPLAKPNALGLSYAKLECAMARMLFYRTSGRSYTSDLCYASITCAVSNMSGPGNKQSSGLT